MRCDPAATLSTLVAGKERAYFIVRTTAPLHAAASGASGIAIVAYFSDPAWRALWIPRGRCSSRTAFHAQALYYRLMYESCVQMAVAAVPDSDQTVVKRPCSRWRTCSVVLG